MKKLFHILLMTFVVLSFSHPYLYSQNTNSKKPANYYTWVKSMDNSYSKVGYLTEINDSSISIMEKKDFKNKTIMIKDIKKLHFRKSNSESKGFLYGALAGFALGAIIGTLGEDDSFPIPLLALAGGITLAVPGTLIGGLIGSAKVNFPINGNQNNYNMQRAKLEKYKYSY